MEMVQVLPMVDEFLRRKHGHFIDGASSQVDSSERLSVLDPSTGNEMQAWQTAASRASMLPSKLRAGV